MLTYTSSHEPNAKGEPSVCGGCFGRLKDKGAIKREVRTSTIGRWVVVALPEGKKREAGRPNRQENPRDLQDQYAKINIRVRK